MQRKKKKRQAEEKNRQIIEEYEQKKEAELRIANSILSQVEDISIITEENLENIGKLEATLTKTQTQISTEEKEISELKNLRDELLVQIEEAKSRQHLQQHHNITSTVVEEVYTKDLSTENDPATSTADAVAEKRDQNTDQKDFRHLLKKKGPATAAPPPAEKPPTTTDRDQKDFRNVLKKRN